jgi:hypothetical protein
MGDKAAGVSDDMINMLADQQMVSRPVLYSTPGQHMCSSM